MAFLRKAAESIALLFLVMASAHDAAKAEGWYDKDQLAGHEVMVLQTVRTNCSSRDDSSGDARAYSWQILNPTSRTRGTTGINCTGAGANNGGTPEMDAAIEASSWKRSVGNSCAPLSPGEDTGLPDAFLPGTPGETQYNTASPQLSHDRSAVTERYWLGRATETRQTVNRNETVSQSRDSSRSGYAQLPPARFALLTFMGSNTNCARSLNNSSTEGISRLEVASESKLSETSEWLASPRETASPELGFQTFPSSGEMKMSSGQATFSRNHDESAGLSSALNSREPKQTTFAGRLSNSPFQAHSPSLQGPAATAQQHMPTALLAEDDPVVRARLEDLLERLGVAVDLVDNGQDATVLAERHRYDWVFLDIRMPVMDGLEACMQIRGQQVHCGPAQPEIIGLTDSVDEEQAAVQCGMDSTLRKPISMAALRRVVGSSNQLAFDSGF